MIYNWVLFLLLGVPLIAFVISSTRLRNNKGLSKILLCILPLFLAYNILHVGFGISFRGDKIDCILYTIEFYVVMQLVFLFLCSFNKAIRRILFFAMIGYSIIIIFPSSLLVYTYFLPKLGAQEVYHVSTDSEDYEIREYSKIQYSRYVEYTFQAFEQLPLGLERQIEGLSFTEEREQEEGVKKLKELIKTFDGASFQIITVEGKRQLKFLIEEKDEI